MLFNKQKIFSHQTVAHTCNFFGHKSHQGMKKGKTSFNFSVFLEFVFLCRFVYFCVCINKQHLPSTSMGVSSEMGTLEINASSLFSMFSIPPPDLESFRAKVVAEFSKEIFLPPACSLFRILFKFFRKNLSFKI